MPVRTNRLAALAVAVWLTAGPHPALACPVCFGAGSERVINALYWSTMVLSLLPLAMVGGVGAWLAYRARARRLADLVEPAVSAT